MKTLISIVRDLADRLAAALTPKRQPEPVRVYIPVERDSYYIRRPR